MTVPPPTQSFRARLIRRWSFAVGALLGIVNLLVYAGVSVSLHRWLDEHVRTVAATETASSTDGPTDVHLHESPYAQLEAGRLTQKLRPIYATDALVRRAPALQATADARAPQVGVPTALWQQLGLQAGSTTQTLVGRIFTFYYFAFFITMPIWTKIDKTKPVPERVPAWRLDSYRKLLDELERGPEAWEG